jgi:hypothetical protein
MLRSYFPPLKFRITALHVFRDFLLERFGVFTRWVHSTIPLWVCADAFPLQVEPCSRAGTAARGLLASHRLGHMPGHQTHKPREQRPPEPSQLGTPPPLTSFLWSSGSGPPNGVPRQSHPNNRPRHECHHHQPGPWGLWNNEHHRLLYQWSPGRSSPPLEEAYPVDGMYPRHRGVPSVTLH